MRTISDKRVIQSIYKEKVFIVDKITDIMNCSVKTARRRFKLWKVLTSCNMNSRFYTLQDIPKFDSNGLWHYRQILFSIHGNLKNTLLQLIINSSGGLNVSELETILKIPVRSFLTTLKNNTSLQREKYHGRYVYFSAQKDQFMIQKKNRINMAEKIKLPSDIEAVAILVEIIKNPGLDTNGLSLKLQSRNHSITEQSIEALLNHHGLTIKKTPDSNF